MNWKSLFAGTVLSIGALFSTGYGQSVEGHITGNVSSARDNSAVLANVSVMQDGEDIGSAVSDSSGFYDAQVGILTPVESDATLVPTNYRLANYPNPFNPSTHFIFQTPKSGGYSVRVFDAIGKEAASWSGYLGAGADDFEIGGGAVGVYFVNVRGDGFSKTHKIMNLSGNGGDVYIRAPRSTGALDENAGLFKTASDKQVDMHFSADHYDSKDTSIVMSTDNPTANVDVKMSPILTKYSGVVSGRLSNSQTGENAFGLTVLAEVDGEAFSTVSGADGSFSLNVDDSKTFFDSQTANVDVNVSGSGYNSFDTSFVRDVNSLDVVLNKALDRVPLSSSFVVHVRDVLDNPIANKSNLVYFAIQGEGMNGSDSLMVFNTDANGDFTFNFDDYHNTPASMVKTWNDTTSGFQELEIARKLNQTPLELNLYQNGRLANDAIDTINTNLDNLTALGEYNLYLLDMRVDGHDMRGDSAKYVLGEHRFGYTTRFIPDVEDTIPLAVLGWYQDATNEQVPQSDIDEGKQIFATVAALSRNMPYKIIEIKDQNDSLYQEVVAGNKDLCYITYKKTGQSLNGLAYSYASNGLVKIRLGSANFTERAAPGTKFTEVFQAMFSLEDVSATGDLGPWVYNNSTNQPKEFAKWAAAYVSIADNQVYKFKH